VFAAVELMPKTGRKSQITGEATPSLLTRTAIRTLYLYMDLGRRSSGFPQRLVECPDMPASELDSFVEGFRTRMQSFLEAENERLMWITRQVHPEPRQVCPAPIYSFPLPVRRATCRERQSDQRVLSNPSL
jgi:hypothetical protein